MKTKVETEIEEKYKNFPDELKKMNNFVCWQGADKVPKNQINRLCTGISWQKL